LFYSSGGKNKKLIAKLKGEVAKKKPTRRTGFNSIKIDF